MNEQNSEVPHVKCRLRGHMIYLPQVIQRASGIELLGKIIKSLIFSTDAAIIRNNNADAILSVYPFTPQPAITEALIHVASAPIFCGVGGGLTKGHRVIDIAINAEFQGASGVVVNQPTDIEVIRELKKAIDIPVMLTICSADINLRERIEAGVDILNVSGGAQTFSMVQNIRKFAPHIPIVATGGHKEEHILKTIEAGANAITYTPPTTAELLKLVMDQHRRGEPFG